MVLKACFGTKTIDYVYKNKENQAQQESYQTTIQPQRDQVSKYYKNQINNKSPIKITLTDVNSTDGTNTFSK